MNYINNRCFQGPLPVTTSDDELYEYFLREIYSGNLKIDGSAIKVFTTPVVDNRMQGFFHLTTRTQKNLGMTIRMKEPRAYFINYIPVMINNYKKCNDCEGDNCKKIIIWTAQKKGKKRTKLLYCDNNNNNYLIVLERNKNDLYIVTSFLIDEPHYLEKILREYEDNKKYS